MDRTGVIILILAIGGLMANMWWSAQKRAEWEREQSILREAEAAEAAEAINRGETPADATDADTAAAAEGRPAALENIPPQPEFEEEITTLTYTADTGTVRYLFTNRGGGIKQIEFPDDRVHDAVDQPVIMNRGTPFAIGALSDGVGRVDASRYEVVDQSATHITYEGTTYAGLTVRRTFSIDSSIPGPAPFLRLETTLHNPGTGEVNTDGWYLFSGGTSALIAEEWQGQVGVAWLAGERAGFRSESAFRGGWFSSARALLQDTVNDARWIGVINQFYVCLTIPAEPGDRSWWARPITVTTEGRRDGRAQERTGTMAATSLNGGVIAPGAQRELEWLFFVGPKNNELLKQSEKDLQKVMLYGNMPIFGWIAQPFSRLLNWAMHRIIRVVPDFGIAIIIITILIRFTIWPLHAKSMRTMKRMSLLNPKIKELKEKYPDDPQKMNQEMMQLYRDYGINPLGGCLPVLLQMPIFFGFYRMLQYAAELRHESFLWVTDLSQPDTLAWIGGIPLNALPLLMAGTMILQMKMTPQTGDKMQRRIFMFLPVIFLFICYNFAAALSLYWTTQNIFSIGQSWYMRRQPEVTLEKKKKRSPSVVAKNMRRQMMGGPAQKEKPKKNRPPRTGG